MREFISEGYKLSKIINLEHIQVFEEEVIAYPAITIIENSNGDGKIEYYDVFDKTALVSGLNPNDASEGVSFALLV